MAAPDRGAVIANNEVCYSGENWAILARDWATLLSRLCNIASDETLIDVGTNRCSQCNLT